VTPPAALATAPTASQATAPPAQAVPGPAGRRWRGGLAVLAAILLIAVNLRIGVTSLGALLDEVRTGLGLSPAVTALITALPTLAFAGLGALTPWLTRRFTADRLLVGAMLALAAGQLLRAGTDTPAVFVATSALALGGIAVANVLLPVLVKEHFPHRPGAVTGAYSVALIAGSTLGAAAAVPVAQAAGSWRVGLGIWAALAAVAVLPLLPAAIRARRRTGGAAGRSVSTRVRPARTRLGWAMALYFGTQSLGAYAIMGWLAQLFRDTGYSPQGAGALLGVAMAVGLPVALIMPALAVRLTSLRPLVLGLSALTAVGYLGLAVAPGTATLVWVVTLAIGQGAFPLALASIGLRARTLSGTVALSAFTQSTGYLIAALGPLIVGGLYAATDGWRVPIGFLLAALAVQTVAGLGIARPRFIEDAD